MIPLRPLLFTAALLILSGQPAYSFEDQWIDTTLRSRFSDAHSGYASVLSPAYLDNDFQYLWQDETGHPGQAAKKLIRLVRTFIALSPRHPLLEDYRIFLQRSQQPMPLALPRYILANDLLYSNMLARLQDDISKRFFLQSDQDLDHKPYKFGYEDAIEESISTPPEWRNHLTQTLINAGQQEAQEREQRMQALVQSLYPSYGQPESLVQAIEFWQQEAEQRWPELPDLKPGQYIKPGEIQPDWIPVMTAQLKRLRHLPEDYLPDASGLYNETLSKAVKALQAQHGQYVDGVIGPDTRNILNRTPNQRIRQLAHNFRRLYYLNNESSPNYIMINMADYRLRLVENHQTTLSMKVITGGVNSRTPIMTQKLTSVILSPRWNIPEGIARSQILPKAFQNPEYLDQNGILMVDGWSQPMKVIPGNSINIHNYTPKNFPYRLVQLPGHSNLLGDVKFRLSNNKAIYLHDTRGHHLFENRERALSNGCIRLESALPLATRILAMTGQDWNDQTTYQAVVTGQERYMKPPELPVYLMYWTVWQDEQGNWQWRDDIYKKDQLPGEPPVSTTTSLLAEKTEDSSAHKAATLPETRTDVRNAIDRAVARRHADSEG
ncbi:L,D-transpeptidase family protein [Oceanospirillum sediminis]|uniref:L,D-transpeptidase family protein n=1 Tax=Oceanospirillum sediminis TaxID=2760088 RepID=A0A839IV06_9GAMM|nr:L,D-transpeptidase family protein [Oceanospirillum sediminis]MBB1488257.1 L,D-transpeptidase family protein [Oceanospirillum sediminis]